METELKNTGIRVTYDKSDTSSGKKFYYWEMKGISLRIEMGRKILKKGRFAIVRRDIADKNERKIFAPRDDAVSQIKAILDLIQENSSRYGEGYPKDYITPYK